MVWQRSVGDRAERPGSHPLQGSVPAAWLVTYRLRSEILKAEMFGPGPLGICQQQCVRGGPKAVSAIPPFRRPIRANTAMLSAMEQSPPLQQTDPRGGKLIAKIRSAALKDSILADHPIRTDSITAPKSGIQRRSFGAGRCPAVPARPESSRAVGDTIFDCLTPGTSLRIPEGGATAMWSSGFPARYWGVLKTLYREWRGIHAR